MTHEEAEQSAQERNGLWGRPSRREDLIPTTPVPSSGWGLGVIVGALVVYVVPGVWGLVAICATVIVGFWWEHWQDSKGGAS